RPGVDHRYAGAGTADGGGDLAHGAFQAVGAELVVIGPDAAAPRHHLERLVLHRIDEPGAAVRRILARPGRDQARGDLHVRQVRLREPPADVDVVDAGAAAQPVLER